MNSHDYSNYLMTIISYLFDSVRLKIDYFIKFIFFINYLLIIGIVLFIITFDNKGVFR